MANNIALAIWPLYFVLALGFLAGKRHAFPADAAKELNKLVLDFALPATLFVSTTALSREALFRDLPALFAVLVAYMGVFGLTFGLVRRRFKRSAPEAAIAALCAASPAGSFFGPAVLPPLFGSGSLVAVVLAALVMNLVQNPIALMLLGGANQTTRGRAKATPLALAKGVVVQPMVWAPLLGLVLVLVGLPVSKIFTAGFGLIGSTSSGVAVFTTGLTLAAAGFVVSKEVIILTAIKMFGLPAIVLGVGLLFHVRGELLWEIVVSSALSSGLLGMMLSSTNQIYVKPAASVTMLSSLLMIVVLPLWIGVSKLMGG